MSAISLIQPDRDLFSWPQYWAACFGPAPFLPMSRDEMDQPVSYTHLTLPTICSV